MSNLQMLFSWSARDVDNPIALAQLWRCRLKQLTQQLVTALLLVVINATFALADFASAPPVTGAAVVTNGRFTNVYLFKASSPGETWDQHLAALRSAGVLFDLRATSEALSGFTHQLFSSHYFDALTQYKAGRGGAGGPINPPVFLGDQKTIESCANAAVRDSNSVDSANRTVISYGTLRTFVACEQSLSGNPSDQVNVMVSPEFNVRNNGDLGDIVTDHGAIVCGGPAAAYHGGGLSVPNFAIIPINSDCNGTFNAITGSLSHEDVEILSDPGGFGYLHETGVARGIGTDFERELGDICQREPVNPGGEDRSISTMPFLGAEVGRYWSNYDNDCEPHLDAGRFATVVKLLVASGEPLKRFTGEDHDISPIQCMPFAGPLGDQFIKRLTLFITTGNDDLREGGSADAIIHMANGSSITIANINRRQHWDNFERHIVDLPIPAGTRLKDLASFSIHASLSGGDLFGHTQDNWNVARVELAASITPVDTRSVYNIVSLNTGLLLDVAGGSQADEAPLDQFKANGGGANQQWSLKWQPDGNFIIISQNSQKAINVPSNNSVVGRSLIQFSEQDKGTLNEEWGMIQQRSGSFLIQTSLEPPLAINVQGSNPAVVLGLPLGASLWNLVQVKAVQQFANVQIKITTGNDNARSDSEVVATFGAGFSVCLKPSNNAQVTGVCANGGASRDQLGQQEWKNWSTTVQTFPISGKPPIDNDTIQLTLISHNSNGESDDNWDIQGITVEGISSSGNAVRLLSLANPRLSGNDNNCVSRLSRSFPTVTWKMSSINPSGSNPGTPPGSCPQ